MYEFYPTSVQQIREFIEHHHYSKSIKGVKVSQCFAIYDGDCMVGAALFGQLSTTAWKKYGSNESDVLELRRLVCSPKCPRNTESWFISKCLKWLKQNTSVKTLVSYADPYYGHIGYVYQASNWVYVGQTPSDVLLIDENGKAYHSRAMRTKYKGKLKPFAEKLKIKHNLGLLKSHKVPGKYTYVYKLQQSTYAPTYLPYPKKQEV